MPPSFFVQFYDFGHPPRIFWSAPISLFVACGVCLSLNTLHLTHGLNIVEVAPLGAMFSQF